MDLSQLTPEQIQQITEFANSHTSLVWKVLWAIVAALVTYGGWFWHHRRQVKAAIDKIAEKQAIYRKYAVDEYSDNAKAIDAADQRRAELAREVTTNEEKTTATFGNHAKGIAKAHADQLEAGRLHRTAAESLTGQVEELHKRQESHEAATKQANHLTSTAISTHQAKHHEHVKEMKLHAEDINKLRTNVHQLIEAAKGPKKSSDAAERKATSIAKQVKKKAG